MITIVSSLTLVLIGTTLLLLEGQRLPDGIEAFHLLLQVALLVLFARLGGNAMERIRLPRLVGEVGVGILLGPTLFGKVAPDIFNQLFRANDYQASLLEVWGWVGVYFLLLEAGCAVNLVRAWKTRQSVFNIGVVGVIFPFVIGFILFLATPEKYLVNPEQPMLFAFFMANAVAISAMVIIAKTFRDMELLGSDLAALILLAYGVNEVLGFGVFSVVLAYAKHGETSFVETAGIMVVTISFIATCVYAGRYVQRVTNRLGQNQFRLFALLTVLGCACGAVTGYLDLTPLLGFFIAGVISGAAVFPEDSRRALFSGPERYFLPVYFASIGLKLDLWVEFDLFLVVFVTIASIVLKYAGAWIGAIATSPKLSRQERHTIGIAFTPSGVTAIVVGEIAVTYQLISNEVLVAIVASAVFSSIIVAPWLRRAIESTELHELLKLRDGGRLRLANVIGQGQIIHSLEAKTRDEAIVELCKKLERGHSRINAARVATLLRELATEGGAFSESGIGICHAPVDGLELPRAAFGISREGIDEFMPGALEPAQLIFVLLVPTSPRHGLRLWAHAQVVRSVDREEKRARILAARNTDEIWAEFDSLSESSVGGA